MPFEFPIDNVRRAKRILLKGGAGEARSAFDELIEKMGVADPYDGRLPAAAGESLLKSQLSALPDESLRKLAAILGNTTFGVALYMAAELLVLLTRERALKYLPHAEQSIDPGTHLYNAASIAYVRAMHGDDAARTSLIRMARRESKSPGFLYNYYVRVLRHFPGNDGEAEWYFQEGYRLWFPKEWLQKIEPSSMARALEEIRLPKEQFVVHKCRTDFSIREPRTGIVYLRPSGSFLTEYGHYPGWKALEAEQKTAASRLMSELSAEEKFLLARTLAIHYHLDEEGLTPEELLTGWLQNPTPFRLFPQ